LPGSFRDPRSSLAEVVEGALAKLTELPGRAQGPEKTPTFQDVYRDIYSFGCFNPFEKYGSQLGIFFPICGKITNVENPQSVFIWLCSINLSIYSFFYHSFVF
jgi:hypothetical protein